MRQVFPLLRALIFSLVFIFIGTAVQATGPQNTLPDSQTLQRWIKQLKEQPRGPFKQIRWFCNDGSILPPKAYACREHGGGVQHGEWSDRVKLLRQHNYHIATLLADLWPETFYQGPDWPDRLKQILLEQYLVATDDGWILRQARYYRGAIQVEDESWHARALLLGLLEQPGILEKNFLLQREAVRLLPHGRYYSPLSEMRQLALDIEQQDAAFSSLRIKLHTRPEAADAEQVLLAGKQRSQVRRKAYLRLAELIEQVTLPGKHPIAQAQQLGLGSDFKLPPNGETSLSANIRYARSSQILREIRRRIPRQEDQQQQLDWLISSLDLEHAFYLSANQLLAKLPAASRRTRLAWIEQGLDALYGIGFLSQRQWDSQKQVIGNLLRRPLSRENYQRQLNQLARISRWAEQQLLVQFETTVFHLATLDPLSKNFFQERLRASPLLPIVQILDSLLVDSQRLRDVEQSLFGQPVTGLQPLNPGLARGRLEIVDNPARHRFSADGIYLLPETVAELPPVAGILTRDAGNSLSHIQLLARNLGIPNLAISAPLQEKLGKHAGEVIVVAVSPRGVIRIESDSAAWRKYFRKQTKNAYLINPDMHKLDLRQQKIFPLAEIRASDSGRIAGPKGANLGELKQIYQQLVPDALIIPFGRFRSFLDSTTVGQQSLFEWMRDNYQQLQQLDDEQQKKQFAGRFLAELRRQIKTAPLDADFITELRQALHNQFGADGSFGVFVRSDTNVEDLPNFTGAGLNKTLPHVVGFDRIVAAIRKVWASPFSERAYSWRQAHMRNPEDVYASVLLMVSVPVDKSGVLVTTDLIGGDPTQLHVAVNEGIGGAVSGQRAEEILIDKNSGQVRLLAQASATQKRILQSQGGIKKVATQTPEQLLTDAEIDILRRMAKQLPAEFPNLRDTSGGSKAADIEFGFLDGQFVLFQIRPLVESKRVKKDLYLQQLDSKLKKGRKQVDLMRMPLEPGS